MTFFEELEARGLIKDVIDVENLKKHMDEQCVVYIGFDPTADCLHVGHLQQICILKRWQEAGHKVIALAGGATGMIGDPKPTQERRLLSAEEIKHNVEAIKVQLGHFLDFNSGTACLVDNYDWLGNMSLIDFLRDYGKYFNVNYMLAKDKVKSRLESGITYAEFSYMILQAYDFYHLYKTYGCTLQLCGGDQWGNVVAGVELVRRLEYINNNVEQGEKREVLGFSTPLLTDSNGKKIGKSEGNAIWTNEELLDPFDYFQYFRNVNDADIIRFLKVYTDFDVEYIESIKDKDINELKKILAFEATKICHGEEVANQCMEKARQIFENNSFEHLEVFEYSGDPLLYVLMKELGFAESNGEAKRLIKGGSVKINDEKISDEFYKLTDDLVDFKLSIGKKKHCRIKR